jgi:hypothetical protein
LQSWHEIRVKIATKENHCTPKMKRTLHTCILTVIISLLLGFQVSGQGFDNIAAAIRTGDASSLSKYFQNNVEINIKQTGNSYSSSQAEVVLKKFFSTNTPKTFSIAHQGTSPEGSIYFIGNLATSSGAYRTYVYAKQSGGNFVIQEIRFEGD